MKAKSVKSPEHVTISASTLLPSLTNSINNGSIKNSSSNTMARDMCTSPIPVCLNNIQNGISGASATLPSKDISSLEGLDNSMFENVSPGHTSNSSPFIRSSSSNSNSSLTLSTNCATGNVNHTVSTIMNPINNSHEIVCKENDSSPTFNYSSDIATANKEQINEVT